MSWRSQAEDAHGEGDVKAVAAQFELETVSRRFLVTVEFWPDGKSPTAEDVFLAIQNDLGEGSLFKGVDIYSITAEEHA